MRGVVYTQRRRRWREGVSIGRSLQLLPADADHVTRPRDYPLKSCGRCPSRTGSPRLARCHDGGGNPPVLQEAQQQEAKLRAFVWRQNQRQIGDSHGVHE